MVTLKRNYFTNNSLFLPCFNILGDVTLVFDDGKLLKAHKVLLSLNSVFFNDIFKSPGGHGSEKIILMQDFSYFTIKLLLQYLYTGQANVSQEDLIDFIETANVLGINAVKKVNIDMQDNLVDLANFIFLEKNVSAKETEINNDKEHSLRETEITNAIVDKGGVEVLMNDFDTSENSSENYDNNVEEIKRKEKPNKTIDHFCDYCGKGYKTRKQLKRHKKLHEGSKFQCEKCPNVFSDKRHLFRHNQSLHEGVTYQCKKCDKEFSQKQNMIRHFENIHEQIKHHCELCNKIFNTSEGVGRHKIQIHEGRKIDCGDCEKKFSQRSSLMKHRRAVHQNLRYTCDICGKLIVSYSKTALSRHKDLHKGQKYDCDNCDYKGNSILAVKMHKRTKHEGVRFFCDKCEYQAPTDWCLRRHMNTVHKHDE